MPFFKKNPRLLVQYATLIVLCVMSAMSALQLWKKGKAVLPPGSVVAAEHGWVRELEELAARIPGGASVGYLSKASTTPSNAESMYQFMFVLYGVVPFQPLQEDTDAQYLIIRTAERPIPQGYIPVHKTDTFSLFKQGTEK